MASSSRAAASPFVATNLRVGAGIRVARAESTHQRCGPDGPCVGTRRPLGPEAVRSLVLVTGATGFVGTALLTRLIGERQFEVRAAVRPESGKCRAGVGCVLVDELAPDTDWEVALNGAKSVVHLSARVHVMRERAADPLVEFRRVNVVGAMKMARQAATGGGGRVFVLRVREGHGEQGGLNTKS